MTTGGFIRSLFRRLNSQNANLKCNNVTSGSLFRETKKEVLTGLDFLACSCWRCWGWDSLSETPLSLCGDVSCNLLLLNCHLNPARMDTISCYSAVGAAILKTHVTIAGNEMTLQNNSLFPYLVVIYILFP